MTVFIIETPPTKLRGELTHWCIEPKPGVFIGNMNSMVRELVWKRISNEWGNLNSVLVYATNNEQGYKMEMVGNPKRTILDMEGIQLIATSN